jgi:hypothetical protein
MSKKFEHCYLHIGTEKTGTSSIQELLHCNRLQARKLGYFYPPTTAQSRSHNTFAKVYVSTSQLRKNSEGVLHRMRKQLQRIGTGHTLIISAEHFHSRIIDPRPMEDLAKFIGKYSQNTTIVIYLRPQIALLESRLSTSLKSGGSPRLPVNMDELMGNPLGYYDYEELLARWAGIFGKDNLAVRIFDRNELVGGDVREDICQLIGLPFEKIDIPALKNESLTVDAQLLLQELNEKIPRLGLGDHPKHWMRLELRRFIVEHSGKGYRLPAEDARRFMAKFEQSNEAVRKNYFPERSSLFNYEIESDRPLTIDEQVSYNGLLKVASDLVYRSLLTQVAGASSASEKNSANTQK